MAAGDDTLSSGMGNDHMVGDNAIELQALVTDGERNKIRKLIGDDLNVDASCNGLNGGTGNDQLTNDNTIELNELIVDGKRNKIRKLVGDDQNVDTGCNT